MIFLSSFGFRSPIVVQKMKEYVPEPFDKKVLVIPFAGFNSENTGIREQEGLLAFGFIQPNVFILTRSNVEEMRKLSFDYIYVPGGDPFKLLSELQSLDLLNDIKRMVADGTDYIGVSAGAMLATSNIEYVAEYVAQLEDNNFCLSNYDGLGLTDDCVVCHIDQLEKSAVLACKTSCPERNLLGIRNDEIIVK